MRRIAVPYPVAAAALALPGAIGAPSLAAGVVFAIWGLLAAGLAALSVSFVWSDNERAAANASVASWALLFLLTLASSSYVAFLLLPLQAILGWVATRKGGKSESGSDQKDGAEQGPDAEQHRRSEPGGDADELSE